MKSAAHPAYRPDIDGLRAIAVLSVVGFHAFPDVVSGGFIGVDVFFVISGFLISNIIFSELKAGTFRFSGFYARRIRRIFPALLLVLSASYVLGWWWLPPAEFKQLGLHMAGGAGFVANFVQWNEAGYFDPTAETKPLLHLWSLGIEEQFYLLWPLLLWLAWKRRVSLLLLTLGATLLSFALNLAGVRQDGIARRSIFRTPVSGNCCAGACWPGRSFSRPGHWGRPAARPRPIRLRWPACACCFGGCGKSTGMLFFRALGQRCLSWARSC